MISPGGSKRLMIALPIVDLPAPLSPTIPKTSHGFKVNETSRTANIVSTWEGKLTSKPVICNRSLSSILLLIFQIYNFYKII